MDNPENENSVQCVEEDSNNNDEGENKSNDSQIVNHSEENDDSTEKGVQVDNLSNELSQKMEEISDLMAKNLKLQKQIDDVTFSRESFVNNNVRTRYFTGLPNSKMLFELEKECAPSLYINGPKLPPFQQMLITLMKLRLNFPVTYLAYRFFDI